MFTREAFHKRDCCILPLHADKLYADIHTRHMVQRLINFSKDSIFKMSSFDNLLLKFDETLTSILADWDIYSTSIVAVIVVVFAYQVFTRRDPDVHPMLLERQAQRSPVRNKGESAVYRSQSSPHGMELNTGLNVRDPGINKWARGRDGDLRDIWRRAISGPTGDDGAPKAERGRIMTVLGTEQIIEHNLGMSLENGHNMLCKLAKLHIDEMSRQVAIIGKQIKRQGGDRVAIYLPNSIEFLITLFACSFHGLTPILLPYDQPSTTILSMIKRSKPDTMIAAAGSLPFDTVTKGYPALRQLIWVVDEGSKHLDWDEVPKGTGGAVNVLTWQEIIEDQKSSVAELPPLDPKDKPKNLVTFWQSKEADDGELVEFSQANLVSAISAQLSSIPVNQRIGLSDLFLPADSLSTVYPLAMTLASLYYNSSLALNSVAGRNTTIEAATQGIAPTIIVASASTFSKAHAESSRKLSSPLNKIVHMSQTRSLTQEGVMPSRTMFTRFNDSVRPAIGTNPGRLRLLFISEQAGGNSPPLSSKDLSDLRIFTGARITYALTGPRVAGAVAQTSFYDYRVDSNGSGKHSHFGPPLSSVEVLLRDTKDHKTTASSIVGEVCCSQAYRNHS